MPTLTRRAADPRRLGDAAQGSAPTRGHVSVAELLPGWRPVHRLDNETSGCLLLSQPEYYETLRQQFMAHTVRKEYQAIVVGLTPAHFVIDTPIGHHPRKTNRMIAVTPGTAARGRPQPAQTEATIIEYLHPTSARCMPLTFLRITIPTGVRHQIRVHLAAQGFPIVGDRLYATTNVARLAPHHCLHASALAFTHPMSGTPVQVSAPLPKHFQQQLLTAAPKGD